MVIALGQSGGRPGLSLERVAINVDDYRIPDNDGNRPVDEPVVEGGPAAYWSTLPIKDMVRAMWEAGIPASSVSVISPRLIRLCTLEWSSVRNRMSESRSRYSRESPACPHHACPSYNYEIGRVSCRERV